MTQTAKMYGGSLYELASEENLATEILGELDVVCDLLATQPDYQHLLCQPNIPKKERCALLDEAFGNQMQPYLLNFLKILCENGTFADVKGCAQEYRNRYNEANGILSVRATSAVALSEAEQRALCTKLETLTGKTVSLSIEIDPACIGGLRVDLQGTQLDGTVKTRLEKMRQALDSVVL